MLASVSRAVDGFEASHQADVHTITLVLNGQHGEFDLGSRGHERRHGRRPHDRDCAPLRRGQPPCLRSPVVVSRFAEVDHAGNPTCGETFMAGTICSLPPGHAAAHGATCQCCGKDWYLEECECHRTCLRCDSADVEEEWKYCDACACQAVQDGVWCQKVEGHAGICDFGVNFFPVWLCQDEDGRAPTEEEIADTIASIAAVGRNIE